MPDEPALSIRFFVTVIFLVSFPGRLGVLAGEHRAGGHAIELLGERDVVKGSVQSLC